jgi:hypothetical protein
MRQTSRLHFVTVSDGAKLVEKIEIPFTQEQMLALRTGFFAFISAFLADDAVFHSAPRPGLLKPALDYAQLARVAEWSKGALAQEDF